ncbi:MAG: hypothetical protein ABIF85_02885 [Nanoarchaeota archaeon]|nr:hypothetical protein [Nanoarchaeota archaeon]MBU4300132.1 hypothetical protein [Nanoarchaeota archaeon]MBU4451584.1 hypothetical protein [Nanoarchaeota archaeon]MCG2724338.1 hypothetical protein [archaeon]
MRRKGTEGMAIEAITGMGYHLIFLLVGLLLIYVIASGYGTELVGKARAAISGMGPCEQLSSVEYKEFMKAINDVYKGCADEDKCGLSYCKEMTMNIPECYNVDRASLDSFGISYVSDIPFCVWTSDKFNLYCGESDGDYKNNGNVDIIYYGQTGVDFCKLGGAFGCFSPVGEYFSVDTDSKVKIVAEKNGLLGGADIKLDVIGGGDYSPCTPAPKKAECYDDTDCVVNSHGYCKNNVCVYRKYCSYLCETKYSSCPTTGPDGEKCRMVKADCTLGGGCTATTGSLTRTCPDGTKTIISKLDIKFSAKAVWITTDPGLSLSSLDFIYGERYYRRVSLPWDRLEEQFYPETNDEIRISFEVKDISNDNKITAYFGCY